VPEPTLKGFYNIPEEMGRQNRTAFEGRIELIHPQRPVRPPLPSQPEDFLLLHARGVSCVKTFSFSSLGEGKRVHIAQV